MLDLCNKHSNTGVDARSHEQKQVTPLAAVFRSGSVDPLRVRALARGAIAGAFTWRVRVSHDNGAFTHQFGS
jgi:hypothetical protein